MLPIFTEKNAEKIMTLINLGVKYWQKKCGCLQIEVAFDPYHHEILCNVRENSETLRIAESTHSLGS